MKKFSALLFVITFCGQTKAQNSYQGIVADSITLQNLSGVYINVKGSNKVAVSNSDGSFQITAKPTDTLMFRMVGYKSILIPLRLQEDALFVLLPEDQIMLQGVVIRSWRLYPDKVRDITLEVPRTRPLFPGQGQSPRGFYIPLAILTLSFSPIDYFFWKVERERRNLKKVVIEQNKSQTFRQVITNPVVKDIMMKDHRITENTYYHLLARFNIEQRAVQYYDDPDAIMIALHTFIDREIKMIPSKR